MDTPVKTEPMASVLVFRPAFNTPFRSTAGASSNVVMLKAMGWACTPVAPAASVTLTWIWRAWLDGAADRFW